MSDLHRVDGILSLDQVKRLNIGIVGLGSLGSLFASNIAPYPWHKLVLIDPENLEEGNTERHLLGRSFVGQPKVKGVQTWLNDQGCKPEKVLAYAEPAENVLSGHTDLDLVVVTTADKKSENFLNKFCIRNNISAVYGGVYPLGTGGEVISIPEPKEICYTCAEKFLGRYNYKGRKITNYGIDIEKLEDSDGNIHAVPALKWTVNAVASMLTGSSLRILLKGGKETYIRISSLTDWEGTIKIRPELRKTLADFIVNQPKMGIVPFARLSRHESGGFALEIFESSLSIPIVKWTECPNHSEEVVSTDQI